MRVSALIGLCWTLGLLAADAPAPARPADSPPAPKPKPAAAARATLGSAAALRNENVHVNRIDNDGLKEANVRLGDNVTIVSQPAAEANYYGTEHGRPPAEIPVLRAPAAISGFHGEIWQAHQNSVFNARTFFQAGPVQPSRQNRYGTRFTGLAPGLGALTGSFEQRKIRGMVNGNVLAPLASERTPLATDPAVRSLVQRYFDAYPTALPNRLDFDPRALNINAPQRIDELDASLRLDRAAGSRSKLSLSHVINRQAIDAFQLVAGQNPDMNVHQHRSRATWRYAPSALTDIAIGAGFTRMVSYLRPEPNAVGPRVRFGFQIEELGPDSQFPIDRAQNGYRAGVVASRRSGAHAMTFGGDFTRFQLNGVETNNQRGVIWFTNNFGRTAIENLRLGTPTTYEVTLGEMTRGFRNWNANLFWADQWRVSSRLQIYYGLRYGLETAPYEVNALNAIPYGCDCDNVSPRLSIALRLPGQWTLRAAYTTSFGQILPVTYSQVRYNLPHARYLTVQNPDLLNPLRGIDLNSPNTRSSPTFLDPGLVSPYVHQYNAAFERRLRDRYLVRLGYVGSRGFKLLNSYQDNRALAIPGIPLTTESVDRRRPDARYYDVKRIVNAGIAYLDFAQAAVEIPYRNGFTLGASYTFGKAIDEGSDYISTAANRDLSTARSQSQFDLLKDKKGLSNFDSTHALILTGSYDLPRAAVRGPLGRLANGWQVSGSTLFKSGTPLTLYIGSDAPGFGNVDGGPSDRPHIVDPSILGKTIGDPNTAPLIMRRDRFAYLTPGESRGSLGRGTFRKGGIRNLNAAATKQWRWGGGREYSLLFRAEAFNLGNTPQFDEPQRNLSSPAFGKITNTLNDGRIFQLGLRFIL